VDQQRIMQTKLTSR